jgi:predicted Zn-dependent peptidase
MKIYIPRNYERLTENSLNKILEDFIEKGSVSQEEEKETKKKLKAAQSLIIKSNHKLEFVQNAFRYKGSKELLCLRKLKIN